VPPRRALPTRIGAGQRGFRHRKAPMCHAPRRDGSTSVLNRYCVPAASRIRRREATAPPQPASGHETPTRVTLIDRGPRRRIPRAGRTGGSRPGRLGRTPVERTARSRRAPGGNGAGMPFRSCVLGRLRPCGRSSLVRGEPARSDSVADGAVREWPAFAEIGVHSQHGACQSLRSLRRPRRPMSRLRGILVTGRTPGVGSGGVQAQRDRWTAPSGAGERALRARPAGAFACGGPAGMGVATHDRVLDTH
jgi:hypothetical protein